MIDVGLAPVVGHKPVHRVQNYSYGKDAFGVPVTMVETACELQRTVDGQGPFQVAGSTGLLGRCPDCFPAGIKAFNEPRKSTWSA